MKILVSFLAFLSSAFLLWLQYKPETSEKRDNALNQFMKTVPTLPRYMEAGYSPLGRSPVVDTLLGDPLYMPTYAEIVSALIKKNTEKYDLFSLSTALLTAGGIPNTVINSSFPLPEKVPEKFSEAFTQPIADKIYSYWLAFLQIHEEVENELKVLSPEDKKWIKENYNRFFFGKEDGDNYEFFTSDNPYPFQFYNLASRINLNKLADAARKLSVITDDFYQFRNDFSEMHLKENFVWEEKGLKLIISQKNHTSHEENSDFFIDLGGSNTIKTNAGGTEGTRSLALHIDLKGNNTYKGENFVQGSGFLGVGLLVNFGGSNTYNANYYSQGCGLFGVGFLVNLEGNNHFNLNFGGQSFALFGSSLLWNKKGNNAYLAKQGMAQAATSTLGVAFLIDNGGHNSYTSGVSGKQGTSREGGIGQGGSTGVRGDPWLNNPSFYGGLSFLYIGEGFNKLKTVWLGQGSAYFLGVGIVVAEGSNDLFEAEYDSQGQGLHLAGGLLLNKGGHGQFKGGWGSLGTSGDRSLGIFIGKGGNNFFQATEQSMGSSRKPKSVGIFINEGNQNIYNFKKFSSASLQYPQTPNEWSSALFLEVGKDSTYPSHVDSFKRGSGLQWGLESHSLGISTDHLDEDLMTQFHSTPNVDFIFDPIQGWKTNTAYQGLVEENPQKLAQEIAKATYDRRRQIYEILDLIRFKDRKNDPNLSYLLQNPTRVKTDAFNYAVLWALRNKDKTDLTEIKTALNQEDFTSKYARKMAVSLVGTFWKPDAAPLLTHIMLSDPSQEIRYYAALALAINSTPDLKENLQLGLKSDSEKVRYAIAKGLQESTNPDALSLVIPLFNDQSFFVRRAAGLTALSLGDKEGVSIVLDTLQYESLDTTENYGDNIYTQLSNYLRVDFGVNPQAWIQWWNQVKGTFKLPNS